MDQGANGQPLRPEATILVPPSFGRSRFVRIRGTDGPLPRASIPGGCKRVSPGEILYAATYGWEFVDLQFTLACCSGVDCGGLAHRHLHLRNMRIESVRGGIRGTQGETQPRVKVL